MLRRLRVLNRFRRRLAVCALAAVLAILCGCRNLGFYSQAIRGQYEIVLRQERIEKLVSNPKTPARVRDRLVLVQELRAFAQDRLSLPAANHYRSYADLQRPFVVWNVQAAPELSLEPHSWWYPFVGRLDYRGYFSEHAARECAEQLRASGDDVYVGGVSAYSTLGWFHDPVLNTFLFDSDADLAETLFHEMAHQRVFAKGDTDFNEAFATSVGQEGVRRWLQSRGDADAIASFSAQTARTAQFANMVARTRRRLALVYGDQLTEEGVRHQPGAASKEPGVVRAEKQKVLAQLEQEFAVQRIAWSNAPDFDAWFARPINNAQLNSVATYYDLVPGFQRLLSANGGDLEKFYQAAERLAKGARKERRRALLGMDFVTTP